MSLYASNSFGYLQQAESFFLSHSGQGLMLGSKDTELLRHWRDRGVPIEVVCAGIHRTFEQFEEPPRQVTRCRKMVEFEMHAWQQRSAGGHDQAPEGMGPSLPGRELPDPTDPRRRQRRQEFRKRFEASREHALTRRIPDDERFLAVWYRSMWRLTDLGQESETELGRDVYRWAYKQMQALRVEALEVKDDPVALSRVALAIGEIEAAMYEQMIARLSPRQRERLDRSIPEALREALAGMSLEARERQMRLWQRKSLEEEMAFRAFFTP